MRRSFRSRAVLLGVVVIGAIWYAKRGRIPAEPVRDVPNASIDVATTTAPTTTSPSTSVAAAPPDINLSPAVIRIDETLHEFPPARLRVQLIDGVVVAHLRSVAAGATHNIDLILELGGNDVKGFADSQWHHVQGATDLDDSPFGIFLDDGRRQLRAIDAKATFDRVSPGATLVTLSGKFLQTDAHDAQAPARIVDVGAEITAATTIME